MKKLIYGLIGLSALTISAPLVVNFTVPLNSTGNITQKYFDRDLDLFSFDGNFLNNPYSVFENYKLSQKITNKGTLITFEFSSKEEPILFSVSEANMHARAKKDGVSANSSKTPSFINTTKIGDRHSLSFNVEYATFIRIDSKYGKMIFQNDYKEYAPDYKYQLKRGEGNTYEEDHEVSKALSSLGWETFPTYSGNLDLVIDFRNPEVHDNTHITNGEWNKPKEFYNLWEWGNNFTFDFTDLGNYVDIELVEREDLLKNYKNIERREDLNSFETYKKQTNGLFNVTNINPIDIKDNTYFSIDEDGYGVFVVKDIINVPENKVVINKKEYQYNSNMDVNDVKFHLNEAGTTNRNGTWFTTRAQEDVSWYLTNYEKGNIYYRFHFLNPVQTTLMILGILWVITLGVVLIVKI